MPLYIMGNFRLLANASNFLFVPFALFINRPSTGHGHQGRHTDTYSTIPLFTHHTHTHIYISMVYILLDSYRFQPKLCYSATLDC